MSGRGSGRVLRQGENSYKQEGLHGGARIFIASLLLLVVVLSVHLGSARGDSAPDAAAPEVTLQEGIAASDFPLTDPQAASELPHTDLDREQVLTLLEEVFEPVLQAPAGPYDDLNVEKFLTPYAAVIDGEQRPEATGLQVGSARESEQSGKYLIESAIPLKVEGEAIDLDLEDAGATLESSNPLVPVEIPEELGDGIGLPEQGVHFDLVGAPEERAPSLIDSAALYPNVAPDTDFMVAPTPDGFETFTSLRSSDAPTAQKIQLSLPTGAVVQEVDDGVAVLVDGEKLLQIHEPVALDAGGDEVPVEMSLEGEVVALEVHPEPSTEYPILVDPLVQSFTFSQVPAGWESLTSDPTFMQARCCDQGSGQVAPGLAARALGTSYSPGSNDHWSYFVPRFWQDMREQQNTPTSFIIGAALTGVNTQSTSGGSSPYPYAGIWNRALKNWAGVDPNRAVWARMGNLPRVIGGSIEFTTGGDKQAQEVVGAGMDVNEFASTGGPREMVVGAAMVQIGDEDLPKVEQGSSSEVWANQTAKVPLEATVNDTGLGARSATFRLPGQKEVKVVNPCAGTAALPCPSSWRAVAGTGTYNPAAMPQGWLMVPVDGEDVLGQKSVVPTHVEVGIDHTPPALSSTTGSLTEQATLGTHKLEYGLKFSATDGFENPATLQKNMTASFAHPLGVATDSNGNVWVVDYENNRIKKFNQAGEYVSSFGSTGSGNGQLLGPCMLAVDKAGNLWVTELGNHRIQKFSPSGAYLGQLKDPSLDSPYGIAISPNGTIWVSDPYRNEIAMVEDSATQGIRIFNRTRGEVSAASGPLAGADTTFLNPAGIAADPQGNVWVADKLHHRLQKISPWGSIIDQVGTGGSGTGQLKSPYGVAVTALGHLLVADTENKRLQVLDSEGDVLRVIGAGGATFDLPMEIAIGPGNTAFVSDWSNNRVQKWSNVDVDSQSGVVKSEVLVDGIPRETFKPSCSGKAVCPLAQREWVLKARDYPEGRHTVQVVVTDGVGLTSSSSEMTVELHPDRTPPQLALSGSATEQASLGSTRPSYKLRIDASDPEPKEGSSVFLSSVNAANGKSLLSPADAAVDAKGNVWVADKGNNRVVEYSPEGAFVREVAIFASNGGKLSSPSGIVVDPGGKVWVADTANNRIVQLNEKGEFLLAIGRDVNKTKVEAAGTEAERNFCTASSGNVCQAGIAGSTGTQLKAPQGIASTTGGNIWVADTGNNRLKKYNPTTGALFNNIGGEGSGPGQVKEPMAIAVGADNSLWVADTGNNRIEMFNSTPVYVRQFGTEGTGSSQFKRPAAIEVDSAGRVWVGDQNNQRVKVFDQTGQFQTSYGSLQPTGDTQPFTPSGIAWGSGGHLYVVDAKNNRVQHWVPGALSQSGIVSSTIKVDGKLVDSFNPGCASENCALTREWTLKSDSYAAGSHTVLATVTDGSGLTESRSLSINIQRDTTSPTVSNTGPLAEAPEGWVEQKTYSFTATATDPNGYGVKQIRLLIDGTPVGESAITSCEAGGCPKGKTFNVNAANYKGGAHEVAVVAEDGAGNWKKQSWTMNVDPQGAVSGGEATDTVEAMEETVPPEEEFLPVASTEEFLEPAVIEAGDNPHFHWEEGSIVSSGVTVDTEFDPSSEVLTIEGTEGPIELTPAAPTSQPTITEGAAAVLPSTTIETDTVIRPEYNGAFMFTTVRGGNAPEDYAWHVKLNSGQYLVQYDPQHIQVMSKTGAEAWLISATEARDATGIAVPTTISILGGSDVVLHLPHRAQGYTYPISAGQSYLTGYATVVASLEIEPEKPTEAEDQAEAEDLLNNGISAEKSAWLLSLDHQNDEEAAGPPAPWTVTMPPMPDGPYGVTVTKLYRSKCGPDCGKWKAKLYNAAIKSDSNESWWEVGTEVHADVTHQPYWLPYSGMTYMDVVPRDLKR